MFGHQFGQDLIFGLDLLLKVADSFLYLIAEAAGCGTIPKEHPIGLPSSAPTST
jgi:hypothetical protein